MVPRQRLDSPALGRRAFHRGTGRLPHLSPARPVRAALRQVERRRALRGVPPSLPAAPPEALPVRPHRRALRLSRWGRRGATGRAPPFAGGDHAAREYRSAPPLSPAPSAASLGDAALRARARGEPVAYVACV